MKDQKSENRSEKLLFLERPSDIGRSIFAQIEIDNF